MAGRRRSKPGGAHAGSTIRVRWCTSLTNLDLTVTEIAARIADAIERIGPVVLVSRAAEAGAAVHTHQRGSGAAPAPEVRALDG